MFCYNCGANIPDGSKHCPACGAECLQNATPSGQITAGGQQAAAQMQPKKKKKKAPIIIAIVVALLVIGGISRVGKEDRKAPTGDDSSASQTTAATESQNTAYVFWENEYVKVSSTGIYTDPYLDSYFQLQVRVENKTSEPIKVRVENGSVNDEMVYMLCGLPDILPGKAANDDIIVSFDDLTVKSTEDIETIGFTMQIRNGSHKVITEEQITLNFE